MKRDKFRSWRFAALVTLLLLAVAVPSAIAVHDFNPPGGDNDVFELDGNATEETSAGFAGDDWATVNSTGGGSDEHTGLLTDVVNADDDTFCGGTKEIHDVSAWKWCDNTASNDKNDVEDAYAAIYIVPSGFGSDGAGGDLAGHRILYVGADRFANNGDSGIGFMFLQSGLGQNACPGHVNCTFNDGAGGTPGHVDGDVYVVSQFTQGGESVTADFYVWDSGAWVLDTSGVDCDTSPANDAVCATVFGDGDRTTNLATDAPWAYVTKFPGENPAGTLQPNDFAEGTFFEGGVDLTARGITGCFKTVLVDTSQSQKINESSQDFVFGSFEECDATLTTTPADASGSPLTDSGEGTSLPDVSIAAGSVDVSDNADLDVGGTDEWSGTLDFYLCGPAATTCDDSGTHIGTQQTVDQDDIQPFNSGAATVTSAGTYCWAAVFTSATTGVPDADDQRDETECFEVLPVTPTLTTNATNQTAEDPAEFGTAIDDTATLGGTANKPGDPVIEPTTAGGPAGGTITFTAYGPFAAEDTPDCSGTAAYTSVVDILTDDSYTGGDGDYTASDGDGGEFIPSAPGIYYWVAVYNGDSPNTNASDATTCGEASETSFVEQIPTEIATKQSWYPNDTATVTSSDAADTLPAGGTVDFSLYDTNDCSGDVLYHEQVTLVGGANSEEVGTNNPNSTSSYAVTTDYADLADAEAGPFSWLVVYDPGDSAHTGIQSACHAEHFTITYTNDAGPGTDLP